MANNPRHYERLILRLRSIVRTERARSFSDRRIKVNRTLAEYLGTDGEIYRKSFESMGVPNVPESGTHEELNAAKTQWK